jgi:hypothetical protein
MQNLSRTSSWKNNKSCSTLHHESNKIKFAFFWFFYDFLRNLRESAKHMYYLRWGFAPGSLEISTLLQKYTRFTLKTLERFQTLQCGPWGGGRRNSGELQWRGQTGIMRGGTRFARDRFGPALGVEMAGGGARGGAQRRHPQRSKLRHGVRRGGAVSGGGSSSGS